MDIDEEFQYYVSLEKCLVGRVLVNIDLLALTEPLRQFVRDTARDTAELKTKFQIRIYDTNRYNPKNHIQAYIDPDELDAALRTSRLTRADIQASLLPGAIAPKLSTHEKVIKCFEGHDLLKTANEYYNEDDRWWTIDLYALPPDHPLRSQIIQRQSRQLKHNERRSDGEVFRETRLFHRNDSRAVLSWQLELSPNKRKNLEQLLKRKRLGELKHEGLVRALDRLLPFPGLWDGFQIGNIHDHLRLHCEEQDVCYVTYVFANWDGISLGKESIREVLDVRTVQNLELRAPSASTIDRNYISQQMECPAGQSDLFSHIENQEVRRSIKEALLELRGVIPTIRTFHHNRRYLAIGVHVIRDLLLDKKTPKMTFFEAMRAAWALPETVLEEVGEYEFNPVRLERPEMAFKFLFIQVFLAAIRRFPYVSKLLPLKETAKKRKWIESGSSNGFRSQFVRRAHMFGFRTRKIADGLRIAEGVVVQEAPITDDGYGETIDRRSGTPYTNAYHILKSRLFLRNLLQVGSESGLNPSVMYIQRDLVNAFFDWKTATEDFAIAAPESLEEAAPVERPTSVVIPPVASVVTPPVAAVVTPVAPAVTPPAASVVTPPTISPQSATSLYTQWSSPSITSEGPGDSRHWSHFSLPRLGGSDFNEDMSETQSQVNLGAERLADDDRRSFPSTNPQDDEREPSLSMEDQRSFPDLTDGESAASTATLHHSEHEQADPGRRSFPGFQKDFTGRRSFPILEGFVEASGHQSTSEGSSPERHVFSDRIPDLYRFAPNAFKPDQGLPTSGPFAFTEYNGMMMKQRSTSDMENYLKHREGWTMMVSKRGKENRFFKTIRSNDIVNHMRRMDGEVEYFLIAPSHTDTFVKRYQQS